MNLLDICKKHLPSLEWQWLEEPFICIGRILNNVISVKVSTSQEYTTITLRVENGNDAVIDFIHCYGKTVEIDTLFESFRENAGKFNSQLTDLLGDN